MNFLRRLFERWRQGRKTAQRKGVQRGFTKILEKMKRSDDYSVVMYCLRRLSAYGPNNNAFEAIPIVIEKARTQRWNTSLVGKYLVDQLTPLVKKCGAVGATAALRAELRYLCSLKATKHVTDALYATEKWVDLGAEASEAIPVLRECSEWWRAMKKQGLQDLDLPENTPTSREIQLAQMTVAQCPGGRYADYDLHKVNWKSIRESSIRSTDDVLRQIEKIRLKIRAPDVGKPSSAPTSASSAGRGDAVSGAGAETAPHTRERPIPSHHDAVEAGANVFRMTCPKCGTRYKVQAQHAGRTAKCRKCGELIVIHRAPA